MTKAGQISTPSDPGDSVLMQWIRDHLSYQLDYCLIWPFARARQGYGAFNRDGKFFYAHRYICEQVHGPAPEGHQAAHSCGRGHDGCVNPRHLSWKTPAENQLDRGPRDYGGRTKLTAEQALEIRELKGKEHVTETALRYGVTEANVRQIQSGKIWRDGRKWTHQFTDDQVRAIRRLPNGKAVIAEAERLGVSHYAVRRVWKRESYKHVSDAEAA